MQTKNKTRTGEDEMSEKRLIDIDELIVIAFNSESRNDIEEEFKKLPKPTLSDVCGTRTLDSMTEEEVKEFQGLLGCPRGGVIKILRGFLEEDSNCRLSIIKLLIEKGFKVWEGK